MNESLIVTSEPTTPPQPPAVIIAHTARHEVRPTNGWRSQLRRLWPITIVAAFAAGWLLANRGENKPEKIALPVEDTGGKDPAAVRVTVETVQLRTIPRTVEGVGTLHGFEEVTISAKVEGRVKKLHRDVADRVKPDAVLLEIDPTDFELAVRQSEKAVDVELSKLGLVEIPQTDIDFSKIPSVMQAQTRMDNAQSRQERIRRLVAQRASSEEELNNISSEFRATQAEYAQQLLMAKSGLAMIQMRHTEWEVARQRLKDTTVRAPIPTLPVPDAGAGVLYAITQRSVSEGSFVRVGTELFKLHIDQTLKLHVRIPERYAGQIVNDLVVEVTTAASTRTHRGQVIRVNPGVDAKTRTFDVEIQIPNPKAELKPGSFAKAAILTREEEAITVPVSSLVNFAGINKLFIMDNGQAKEVQVTLGPQTTEWAEVAEPALPPNTQVITSGQTVLANGTPVVVGGAGK